MQHPEFYKQLTLSKENNEDSIEALSFDKIGPYSIDSLLSKSAKSHIFLAHDKTHKPFALKILSEKFTKEKKFVDQFLQEAKILKMTHHENIIRIIDQGIADQKPFLVMEFVQGISLRQFIVHYNLSFHDAIEILLQLAYALSHIHSHGIIHLDLKPENILITQNAKIKLLDFGISQFLDSNKTIDFLGSPDYMSPEMKANKTPFDASSDIYSLGVIAFELFTSKLCFGKIDLSLTHDFVTPFLRKCLALDKKARFNDIIDCIASLNSIIKTHPIATNFASNQAIEDLHKELYDDLIEHTALEMGIAYDLPAQNFFYTSNQLADQSILFLFYNFEQSSLETLCQITKLKCATTLLLNEQNKPFDLNEFLESLNTLTYNEKNRGTIDFQAIHLNLFDNTLHTAGSAMATIFLYSNRKNSVEALRVQGHKLGEKETLDNNIITSGFNEQDQLMLHNFMAHFPKIAHDLKNQSISLFQETHLSGAKNLATSTLSALKKTCHANKTSSCLFTFELTRIE